MSDGSDCCCSCTAHHSNRAHLVFVKDLPRLGGATPSLIIPMNKIRDPSSMAAIPTVISDLKRKATRAAGGPLTHLVATPVKCASSGPSQNGEVDLPWQSQTDSFCCSLSRLSWHFNSLHTGHLWVHVSLNITVRVLLTPWAKTKSRISAEWIHTEEVISHLFCRWPHSTYFGLCRLMSLSQLLNLATGA